MSMRKAFEKWWKQYNFDPDHKERMHVAFDCGYQAAIADVKAGGAVAECTNNDKWNCKYCNKTQTCEALQDKRNYAAPVIPAGWVMIPGNPTREMIDAGLCGCMDNDVTVCIYKAMLSAAPKGG